MILLDVGYSEVLDDPITHKTQPMYHYTKSIRNDILAEFESNVTEESLANTQMLEPMSYK